MQNAELGSHGLQVKAPSRQRYSPRRPWQFSHRTRDFIDFVLDHYVTEGVEELDPQKLPELLQLKYGGVSDALRAIGVNAESVRVAFSDFQKFLYEESAA